MKRDEVKSTLLKSVGYDVERKILEVEFLDGTIYGYFDVPKEIYDEFMKAKSKGRFYNEIKNLFKYENSGKI